MLPDLYAEFPNLKGSNAQATSPRDLRYNCIAWAAGESHRFWWCARPAYWPPGVDRVLSLEVFQQAFGTLGYAVCANGDLEPGVEKIALYVGLKGPTHAARQLENGQWTSKMGRNVDIRHELNDIAGGSYGAVACFMSRPRVPRGRN